MSLLKNELKLISRSLYTEMKDYRSLKFVYSQPSRLSWLCKFQGIDIMVECMVEDQYSIPVGSTETKKQLSPSESDRHARLF